MKLKKIIMNEIIVKTVRKTQRLQVWDPCADLMKAKSNSKQIHIIILKMTTPGVLLRGQPQGLCVGLSGCSL